MGIFQPLQKPGVNIMGGETPLSANPEKGRSVMLKINM